APPPAEKCEPYIAIANALRAMGLNTPDIIKVEKEQGFLLITDFGDETYLKVLNIENASQLYQTALQALSCLQGCRTIKNHTLPAFNADFMQKEWQWHKTWFLEALLS